MHLGDGGHAAHGIAQRRLDVFLRAGIGLQVQERRDDLQAVADAMIDLAQQNLAFRGKRGIAIARSVNLGFGVVASLADAGLAQRAFDRDVQQRNEIALRILHQIIVRAGLERRHGDLAVLRGGDEHHRRSIGNCTNPFEDFEAVETGHVLIQRDHIDTALGDSREARFAVIRMHDIEALPRKAATDQTGEGLVVVHIQKAGIIEAHVVACGT